MVASALAGWVSKKCRDDTDWTGLFPIKLFEILACGISTIVSDYPGQAHLVRSVRALPGAVARIIDNLRASKGMGARHAAIAADHSWDGRARQSARFIERAVAAHAAPTS